MNDIHKMRLVRCRHCRKEFLPAPEHAYKDNHGLYCSWRCKSAHDKEQEAKEREKMIAIEKRKAESAERRRERARIAAKKRYGNGYAKKKCLQYSVEGELIAVYDSVSAAAESVGLTESTISRCCSSTTRTGRGYIWRLEDKTERI